MEWQESSEKCWIAYEEEKIAVIPKVTDCDLVLWILKPGYENNTEIRRKCNNNKDNNNNMSNNNNKFLITDLDCLP